MKVKKFVKKYIGQQERRINIYSEQGRLLDRCTKCSIKKYNNYHIIFIDAHGIMVDNQIGTVLDLYVCPQKKKDCDNYV